ncbi:MAG: hypothetical protein Q4C91_23645, partial [Eubacteriales bacterium]|nr:hypothetical protein [Eubacteriales bacterium]
MNLSAVVNMMIKQIILTENIPFEVKINHSAYSASEVIKEVCQIPVRPGSRNLWKIERRRLPAGVRGRRS